MAWVIRTKYTGKLFAGRVDSVSNMPCVVVFETKQQAVRMRHMINLMRPDVPVSQPDKPTGNWLIDNANKLKPPHQPLSIEKWSLASVLSVCSNSALDVALIPEDADADTVIYPANREYSDDVRFALDCTYMYGGAMSDHYRP
jgi:hypothetical protein